jgi:hypothetical protein
MASYLVRYIANDLAVCSVPVLLHFVPKPLLNGALSIAECVTDLRSRSLTFSLKVFLLNTPLGFEQTTDSLCVDSSLQHLAQEVQETVDLHWHPRRLMGHRDDFHRRGEGLRRFGHLPHLPWYR